MRRRRRSTVRSQRRSHVVNAPRVVEIIHTPTVADNLRRTVELIGRGIKAGASYLPLRDHAASLATTAKPKDYMGQVQAIYNDFLKRWRYVHDPDFAEWVTIGGPQIWGQIWGADQPRGKKGYGDCDDATVAIGAALAAIGMPVRIVTIATLHAPGLLSHVYPEVKIPGRGWLAIDPVGHPAHPLGWAAPARRSARWSVDGQLIERVGNWPASAAPLFAGEGDQDMQGYQDFGFSGIGIDLPSNVTPLYNWNDAGPIRGFGAYANTMGLIADASGFLAEYDDTDEIAPGVVRTKMLEFAPQDWAEIARTGQPRIGAVALADDGDVYQYMGSFFKKLFSKIKTGIKKVAKKIGSVAKKIISKLPGGKYLIKLYDRVHKIAMKIVRPLAKFVGKYAAKLAPVAALIPGYGPAIAGALYTAGKIAKVMQATGVTQDPKGKPIFKSGKQASAFQRALKAAARKEKLARQQRRRRQRQQPQPAAAPIMVATVRRATRPARAA